MRESRLALAAVPIAMLVLYTPQVFAIMCYQCNSKVEPSCADALLLNSSTLYQECGEMEDGKQPFCRKSVIKVLAAAGGRGEERVVRTCGWLRSTSDCYQVDDDDHHELVCQCFTDGCNGAPPVAVATTLLRVALTGAALAAGLPLCLWR